jgi:hypothetical protein
MITSGAVEALLGSGGSREGANSRGAASSGGGGSLPSVGEDVLPPSAALAAQQAAARARVPAQPRPPRHEGAWD